MQHFYHSEVLSKQIAMHIHFVGRPPRLCLYHLVLQMRRVPEDAIYLSSPLGMTIQILCCFVSVWRHIVMLPYHFGLQPRRLVHCFVLMGMQILMTCHVVGQHPIQHFDCLVIVVKHVLMHSLDFDVWKLQQLLHRFQIILAQLISLSSILVQCKPH